MNHFTESPAQALDRGMGAVPMADMPTPPTATQPGAFRVWLTVTAFLVVVFGVGIYALWSVTQ